MASYCINVNIGGSGGGNSFTQQDPSWGNSSSEYKGNWNYDGNGGNKISQYDDLFKKAGNEVGIDWRLVAAHAYRESRFNANAKNSGSSATGLYQITLDTWKGCAPKGYKDDTDGKYRKDPNIATQGYINLMKQTMNRFKNAESRNDQILLTLQSYHDGIIGGTSWKNVKGNQYTYKDEGRTYVPKIMEQYKNYGGQIS